MRHLDPLSTQGYMREIKNATLPETNSSHLKIGLPNRKVVFQPSNSRGYVSFREGDSHSSKCCGKYHHLPNCFFPNENSSIAKGLLVNGNISSNKKEVTWGDLHLWGFIQSIELRIVQYLWSETVYMMFIKSLSGAKWVPPGWWLNICTTFSYLGPKCFITYNPNAPWPQKHVVGWVKSTMDFTFHLSEEMDQQDIQQHDSMTMLKLFVEVGRAAHKIQHWQLPRGIQDSAIQPSRATSYHTREANPFLQTSTLTGSWKKKQGNVKFSWILEGCQRTMKDSPKIWGGFLTLFEYEKKICVGLQKTNRIWGFDTWEGC